MWCQTINRPGRYLTLIPFKFNPIFSIHFNPPPLPSTAVKSSTWSGHTRQNLPSTRKATAARYCWPNTYSYKRQIKRHLSILSVIKPPSPPFYVYTSREILLQKEERDSQHVDVFRISGPAVGRVLLVAIGFEWAPTTHTSLHASTHVGSIEMAGTVAAGPSPGTWTNIEKNAHQR
jgi:hypothetical protein